MKKVLVLAALTWVLPLSASVAFSDLGAGQSFSSLTDIIDADTPPNIHSVAYEFTSALTGSLSSIEMALSGETTATAPLTITLRVAGALPTGTILETWTIQPGVLPGIASTVTTLDSVALPGLTAGTSYWLRADSASPTPNGYGWSQNNQGLMGSYFTGGTPNFVSVPTSGTPAFEVDVAPEPSEIILTATGLLACLVQLRRRNDRRQRAS